MPKTLFAVTLALLSSTAFAQVPQQPPIKAGFPLTLPGQGAVTAKPALADLKIAGDTAGVRSIVFGGNNGNLHVIHRTSPTTWAEAPGWVGGVAVGAKMFSSPAVGDLTGDGIPEIVVGYGDPFAGSLVGGVKAFRNNGTLLWDRPSLDRDLNGRPDAVVGTPAIGDVDGDGQNDVVWGSTDFKVYFVNGSTGANKPNWPRDVLDSVLSSVVLHDMDGDLRPEIIVGVDAHLDPTFGTPNGGCLHVIPGAQPVIPANPFPANVGYPPEHGRLSQVRRSGDLHRSRRRRHRRGRASRHRPRHRQLLRRGERKRPMPGSATARRSRVGRSRSTGRRSSGAPWRSRTWTAMPLSKWCSRSTPRTRSTRSRATGS